MSNETAGTCKLSMLWNWDTVDSCFISEQWHTHTTRQYVATLLVVFLVVVLLEGFRRMARAYDRYILRQHQRRLHSLSQVKVSDAFNNRPFKPSIFQHLIRSLFYFIQFGTGYLLMLAAMTHNGGLIISLFVGALVGYFIFGKDTVPGATIIETSDYGIYLEQVGLGKERSKA